MTHLRRPSRWPRLQLLLPNLLDEAVADPKPLRVQAGLDVTQTLAIGQLGKGQGAELLGASEVANPAVAVIMGHAAGKRGPGKEIHQLRKQQLASVHRRRQRQSLDTASRQFQIDTTQKQPQLLVAQRVAGRKLAVNRTVVQMNIHQRWDMIQIKSFPLNLKLR